MATLLLDLGNTRLKWGWVDDGVVCDTGSLAHGGTVAAEALDDHFPVRPERVVCAAVAAEPLVMGLADWVDRRWGREVEWAATEAEAFGIRNSYDDPRRMGADRWLAMVGARARETGPVCVIDAGTAITVDQVAADGRHLGGWIVAGRSLMGAALYGGTGRIPPEPPTGTPDWGRSTAESVAAGLANVLAGLIRRVSVESRKLHGSDPAYLVTGGDGGELLQYLEPAATLAPHLVLEGLALWAARRPRG